MTAITRTNIAAGPNSGIVAFVELVDSEEPVFDGAVDPVDGDSEEPVFDGAVDPVVGDSEEPVFDGTVDPVVGDSEEPVFDGAVDPVDGGVLDAVAAKVDGAIARIATRVKTLNSALIDFDFIVISDNLYFIKTLQFLFYQ